MTVSDLSLSLSIILIILQQRSELSDHSQAAPGGRGQCGEPRHDHLYYEVQVQNRLSNEYVPLHVIN